MTSIVLFSLTILLTSAKATNAQGSEPTLTVTSLQICPRNEIYRKCWGPCYEDCTDGSPRPWCDSVCRDGCFCKDGYKREKLENGKKGKCVPQDQCPRNNECTKPNETWTTCGNDCRERCGSGLHSICPEVCKIGCSCKTGYKRDKNGQCVLENECTGECSKPNEEWTNCGNPCIEQCDDGSSRVCTKECKTRCSCKKGYKRLNGTCIPEMKCPPPKCPGLYEIYKMGVNCTDFCNKHLIRCKAIPQYGCYCKDGYARDLKTGVCRPYPCSDCGKNAEWVNCAGSCDNHCDFVLGRDTCKIFNVRCPDGCRCKKGFARSTNSTTSACIPERKCCSGPYEVYKEDGNPCMDKCNKDVVRCKEAHKSGCYCRDGYARDVQTGVCRPFPCKDCGKHAHWAHCTGGCDNRCDFVLGRKACTITVIKCLDACRCDKGYARQTDDNSPCIPIKNCTAN